MTCSAHRDLDLAAYVAAPRDAAFAAFREHSPACATCSAALAEWLPLEDALREVAGEHPEDDALLAFASDEATFPVDQRAQIAAHLDGCAPCRDALAAFRAFQAGSATAVPAPLAEARAQRAWGLSPRRVALAAAAVLLAAWLLPTFIETLAPADPDRRRVAETQLPAPENPAPPPERAPVKPTPERIAAEPEPAAQSERIEVVPETEPPVRTERVAVEPDAATGTSPETPTAPQDIATQEPDPEPAPVTPRATQEYVASLGANPIVFRAGPGLPEGRIGAGSRSAVESLGIIPLVPQRIGLSHSASPTLRWYQATASEGALILTLSDPVAMENLASHRVAGPVRSGQHAMSLARIGVTLPAGRDVQWVLALEEEPGSAAGGIIRHVPAPASARGDAETRLRAFAEEGYWYDAVDLLAASVARQSSDPALRSTYAALLEEAGLAAPAAAIRAGK